MRQVSIVVELLVQLVQLFVVTASSVQARHAMMATPFLATVVPQLVRQRHQLAPAMKLSSFKTATSAT
jgi:hypothetical protein